MSKELKHEDHGLPHVGLQMMTGLTSRKAFMVWSASVRR